MLNINLVFLLSVLQQVTLTLNRILTVIVLFSYKLYHSNCSIPKFETSWEKNWRFYGRTKLACFAQKIVTRVRGTWSSDVILVCLLLPQCETLGGCNPKRIVHGEKVHRKFRFRAGKGRRLICVAGGIVSESKVMAEKLCSRAENGEETLWRMTGSPPKLS